MQQLTFFKDWKEVLGQKDDWRPYQEQKQPLLTTVSVYIKRRFKKALELISSNIDAARLVTKLKTFFTPLDLCSTDQCPWCAGRKTIAVLSQPVQVRYRQRRWTVKLRDLIAAEQTKKASAASYALRSFGKSLQLRLLSFCCRHILFSKQDIWDRKAWQTGCEAQLMKIGQGLAQL